MSSFHGPLAQTDRLLSHVAPRVRHRQEDDLHPRDARCFEVTRTHADDVFENANRCMRDDDDNIK